MRANSLRILAVLLIVVGIGIAVVGYLQATAPEPVEVNDGAENDRKPTPQRVVVASRTIEAGERIEASAIEVTRRSVEESGESAADALTPEEVVGRRALLEVSEGDVVTTDLLEAPEQVTPLAGAVAPGHKALAIEVNEIEAAGGYLVPGDKVDLIWFLDHREGNGPYARTLVREVRVLAFGEAFDREAPAASGDRQDGPDEGAGSARDEKPADRGQEKDDVDRQPRARSVVLELTDDHIADVLLAARTGQIRLAVHASGSGEERKKAGSESQSDEEGRSLHALLGTTRNEPPPRARPEEPAPERVRVFKGRDTQTVEVD